MHITNSVSQSIANTIYVLEVEERKNVHSLS